MNVTAMIVSKGRLLRHQEPTGSARPCLVNWRVPPGDRRSVVRARTHYWKSHFGGRRALLTIEALEWRPTRTTLDGGGVKIGPHDDDFDIFRKGHPCGDSAPSKSESVQSVPVVLRGNVSK